VEFVQNGVANLLSQYLRGSRTIYWSLDPESGLFLTVILYRYSLVVKDDVVQAINVEPDGKGLTCSLSNVILDQL
jgi:peroxiredoxin